MKVTTQQVKELQKRVDVTYEEAERTLLKAGGDIDKAEQRLNHKRASAMTRVMEEVGRIYRESLTYYLKITRKNKIVLDLPLMLVVGLFLIMTVDSKIWVGIVGIGAILISESTVNIYRTVKEDKGIIKKTPDMHETSKAPETSEKYEASDQHKAPGQVMDESVKTMAEDDGNEQADKDNDDDYYEITIEK